MADDVQAPVRPAADERGLATWEPADIAGLLLPAWDAFIDLVTDLDLDGPTRLPDRTARELCVHVGVWPGSRSLPRLVEEAARADLVTDDPRGGVFDQASHDEAVLEAWSAAPHAEILSALATARADVAAYLRSAEAATLGSRRVRTALGPLPLTTMVAAVTFDLAVHALDLAPAGAAEPPAPLLAAGLAALTDTTGALASRQGITAYAATVTPGGGWAFSATPQAWLTVDLAQVPPQWPAVAGETAALLDASAGRRAVPAMLATRELRLHHVGGLLALTPLLENVPGLPGGAALRMAARTVRTAGRLLGRRG